MFSGIVETFESVAEVYQGTNLLTLRPLDLIAFLKSKPWVENVVIKKEYPSRIFVDIETKRPQALTLQHGQTYFLDSFGQVIEKSTSALLKVLDLLSFLVREYACNDFVRGYANL